MAKFRFVEWLAVWLSEAAEFDFEWDAGNRSKNASKHAVATNEVEDAFASRRAAPLGVQVSPATAEARFGIIGATSGGRILHIVFTLRAGRVRPISARPAKRKERGVYEAYIREISA